MIQEIPTIQEWLKKTTVKKDAEPKKQIVEEMPTIQEWMTKKMARADQQRPPVMPLKIRDTKPPEPVKPIEPPTEEIPTINKWLKKKEGKERPKVNILKAVGQRYQDVSKTIIDVAGGLAGFIPGAGRRIVGRALGESKEEAKAKGQEWAQVPREALYLGQQAPPEITKPAQALMAPIEQVVSPLISDAATRVSNLSGETVDKKTGEKKARISVEDAEMVIEGVLAVTMLKGGVAKVVKSGKATFGDVAKIAKRNKMPQAEALAKMPQEMPTGKVLEIAQKVEKPTAPEVTKTPFVSKLTPEQSKIMSTVAKQTDTYKAFKKEAKAFKPPETETPISKAPYEEMAKAGEAGFLRVEADAIFSQSKKSQAYKDLISKNHPFKKLEDLATERGVDVPWPDKPYANAQLHAGVQGIAETNLFRGRIKRTAEGNVEFYGKSFAEILKPHTKDLDAFSEYLIRRHVPEVEARGIKTGLDVPKSVGFVKKYKDQFESAAVEFTDYRNYLLDELVDSGRISPDIATMLKDRYANYAPLQRVIEDLKQYGHVPTSKKILSKIASPVKRLKGSDLPIIDPLETTIQATYTITEVAARNRIARSISKFSETLPDVVKKIKPKMDVVAVLEDGTKVYRPSKFQKQGVIEVWDKGNRSYFEVPPDIYEAMSGLSDTGMSWLTKILATPARILRTGATTTPEFMFRNPLRDQTFAFVNARHGYVPGWDFARGLFDLVGKTDLYWKWKASGGDWSMLVTLDRAFNQATLKRVAGFKDAKKYLRNPISLLEDASRLSETPTRLGIMKRSKGKGVSDTEAAFTSREGSIDFGRRGAKTKDISQLYTFLNARTQAIDMTMRTIRANPGKAMLKISAISVVPSILNYVINRDDPTYWEIPEWQRNMFWMFRIGKQWIRIPKGDMGVGFGTATEKILAYIDQNPKGKIALDKLARDVFTETMPLSNPGDIIPVAFRGYVEAMANKSFFRNRPIVPPWQEILEPKEQYTAFTSETAKAVGKVFNVSPAKIEHAFTSVTAGLGRHFLKANDTIMGEMGILEKGAKVPKTLADIPGVKAFAVRDPIGFGSESVQNFYDTLAKIERFDATKTKYKKEHRVKDWLAYVQKHAVEAKAVGTGLAKDMKNVRTDLAKLRQMKQRVLDSKEIDVDMKKKATEEIHRLVMAKVVQVLVKYNTYEEMLKGKKWQKLN